MSEALKNGPITAGTRQFVKMHGIGNDFAVFDARRADMALVAEQVRLLCDRRLGVGCDQLIIIERARLEGVDAHIRFFNADGSQSGACGNGTRCVAGLLFAESPRRELSFTVEDRLVKAWSEQNGFISVDMGKPGLDARAIPLAQELDTLALPIKEGRLINPSAVSMGNPHMVFFVDQDVDVDLDQLGPILENHALFPERANVSIAKMTGPAQIQLEVWERGAGRTLACGTAACATLVAASRRGLVDRTAEVRLPGGTLGVTWNKDDHVILTGPIAVSFMGMVEIPAIAGMDIAGVDNMGVEAQTPS